MSKHLLLFRLPLFMLTSLLLLMQACKKDKEEILPKIQTLEITNVQLKSVTLNGNIITTGQFPVVEHGFIYTFTPSISESAWYKVSLGRDAREGNFDANIIGLDALSESYPNPTLYAKAYVKYEKGTTYGQIASVALPRPNVGSISPQEGKAGQEITITGNFYTSNPSEVSVKFGNSSAKLVEVSPSRIVVEVPKNIYDIYNGKKYITVSLQIGSKSYTVLSNFKVIPSVYDFSPKVGDLGSLVYISTDNLPAPYYSSIRVYFGQVQASISVSSMTEIRATVPYNLTAEKSTISVVVDDVTTVLPGEFSISQPEVNSFSPLSGFKNSTLYIYGNKIPSHYYSNLSVKIGGEQANIISSSSTQIAVAVPTGLYIGSHKVEVSINGTTFDLPQQYEVISPAVYSFSPTSGGTGQEISINGIFQAGLYYTVYFGTVAVNSYPATANTLRVIVPPSLPAGTYPLSVLVGTQRLYAYTDYTLLPAAITSFSPDSGVAGTTVTISTENFVPSYYTAVRFGNTYAQVISYTSKSITVRVPTGITGPVKINVLHNGLTITSATDFTVN